MILKIFTVYDSKAKAYLAPFYMHEEGMATRIFGQTVNDKTHAYGKSPSDYTLFNIGEFDDNTAKFNPITPISLGNGVEFLTSNKEQPDDTNDTKRDSVQPGTTS